MKNRYGYALLGIALLTLHGPALAGFTLVTETRKASAGFELLFENGSLENPHATLVPNPAYPLPDIDPDSPSPEVLGLAIPPDAGPAFPCQTSGLLGLSANQPDEGWTVVVEPPDAAAHVRVSPARIGSVRALQVIVDRCGLGEGNDILISLEPATLPEGRAVTARAADPARINVDWLRPALLNGAQWQPSVPTLSLARGTTAPLAEVPGDWRLSWRVIGSLGEELPGEILAFDPAEVGTTPATLGDLRLVYNGVAIPVGGMIGGNAWFYAPRAHTDFNEHDSAFATPSASVPSPAMATRPAFGVLAPQSVEVAIPREGSFAYNLRYERDGIGPAGQRVVIHRLQGGTGAGNNNRNLPINDRLTSATFEVEIEVHGLNQSLTVNPDHYADFYLAGNLITRRSWNGRTILRFVDTITLPTIPTTSTIQFRHTVPGDTIDTPLAGGIDIQNLEEVILRWTGKPRLDANGRTRVDLAADSVPRLVTVGGFPLATVVADVLVLDVTDELAPVRLTGLSLFPDETGGTAVEFEAPASAATFVVHHAPSLAPVAAVVETETLPDPLGPGEILTAIYIRPEVYADNLAPLVALRGTGGILSFSPEAAYNAFSDGRTSLEAIRQALAHLISASEEAVAVPTVLLMGHASFDPRNYLGSHASPKVPSWVDTGTIDYNGSRREYTEDYRFSLLFGDDEFPDVAIGRLPARTEEDVDNFVARLLAYEPVVENLRTLDRQAFFLTDNTPPFGSPLFGLQVVLWEEFWSSTGRPSLHHDSVDAVESRPIITEQFEKSGGGTALALYVGHGNFEKWMQGNGLTRNMVRNEILTDDQWPFVLSLTCQNGLYAHPSQETASESLAAAWNFAAPERGAIGIISTTTEETYSATRPVIEEFMRGLGWQNEFRAETAGQLFVRGQVAYMIRNPEGLDILKGQTLFGDPDVSLALDYIDVPITRVMDWQLLDPH